VRSLIVALVILALVAAFWGLARRDVSIEPAVSTTARTESAVSVSSEQIDPSNEGRLISVLGELRAEGIPRDDELGVAADGALVLRRDVEMFQWQEQCMANACSQRAGWSSTLIDSGQFKEKTGNANPADFPFHSTRFVAPAITLGAFAVSPELIASGLQVESRAVRLSELPPNLAASFIEHEGRLFAGSDPLAPAIGDLRVMYSVVPAQVVTLIGVQRGQELVPAAKAGAH
jgi:hypothetical protein